MDRISNIPLSIIEIILCFLPIEEAVRTSILSREWRYRWNKIPKLTFIEEKFQASSDGAESSDGVESADEAESSDGAESSDEDEPSDEEQPIAQASKRQKMDKKSKFLYDICQVLLMHMGPIHEFSLKMITGDDSCVEIDRIIFYLSRKTDVKKLTLDLNGVYSLPLSFFSMTQLTGLYLSGCSINHRPAFSGFGGLTSLYVYGLWTTTKTLTHLLSNCPMLKTVTMKIEFGTVASSDDSTITNLFECLPAVENLSLRCGIIECFAPDGVPKEVPTALVHLKYLCVEYVCFLHNEGLPNLFLLIRSSPKLEKLRVEIIDDEICLERPKRGPPAIFTSFEKYSDIWLEHLTELEVTSFGNATAEMDLIKLILAKSPMLRKVTIIFHKLQCDEEYEIEEILSCSRRASRAVKIIAIPINGNEWW